MGGDSELSTRTAWLEAGRTHAYEMADAIEIAGNALGKVDIVVAHSLGAMATAVAMQRSLKADRRVLISSRTC